MALRGGIDNGVNGGIVFINERRESVAAIPMPVLDVGKKTGGHKRIVDSAAVLNLLRAMQAADTDLFVCLEQAQAYPQEGAALSFNYGRGFGVVEGILLTLGIQFVVEDPKRWQAVALRGVEGADTKAQAVVQCARSLPTVQLIQPRCRTPHLGVADAACMALYALTRQVPVVRPQGAIPVGPPAPPPRVIPPPPRRT